MVNFSRAAFGECDQLVGFPQLERDRFFQQDVLAGAQAVARDRIMVLLRRGADIDDGDIRVLDDVLIVERRGRGLGQRLDFRQAVGPDFADVQLVDQRRARQAFPRECRRTSRCRSLRLRRAPRCFSLSAVIASGPAYASYAPRSITPGANLRNDGRRRNDDVS